ncbi:phosphoribosyltransferase [Amycolatopsis thermalba]|uniref:Phosphoribosyltransferase n=1 Tax=Amycolatopsis thermalba TaxID=944492 RepID=A0ABY4P1V8_9PSEU|nr:MULTISPECIES: phosphoribosyltransferase [Amycolatopsis]UQS26325.1 phosphoribosyltransferase [Amycolatopsis thermalba]
MSASSGITRYRPDHRGNRLDAWSIEQSGSTTLLKIRGSKEIAEHILGALPRAEAQTPGRDSEWTCLFRMDFRPPDELTDFLRLLEEVLVLRVRGRYYLDGAVAFDFYKIPDTDGTLRDSPTAILMRAAKDYGPHSDEQRHETERFLCKRLSRIVREHLWFDKATKIVPVPGHDSKEVSASMRIGTAVARETGREIVEVKRRISSRPPAKEMSRADRASFRWEYRVDEDLEGQTVLLIDDVYETGQTMDGVAAAAKYSGAKTVVGLAALRTLSN